MRLLLVLIIVAFTGRIVVGQDNVGPRSITGTVAIKSGEAVMFANVALYTNDSVLLLGTTTDENGNFALNSEPGSYYISISFLSLETKVIADIEKQAGKLLNLGRIVMTENSQMLNEVVIEGERSQMEFKLDKRVFNVGQDLSNSGGNAADILSNVPSVDVDIEGNISLRGSQNVRILIDGKPSGLTSTADALRMLQSSMIEQIEIITNPSSKYEAEGEVGILNIVLKKEKQKGFNGSVEAKAGFPANHGFAFNLNYRRKKINLFGSAGINYRNSPGFGNSEQFYNGPDTNYHFQSERNHTRGGYSRVNRFGADFFINDRNTFTASVLYKLSEGNNEAILEYRDLNNLEEVTLTTTREELENEISQDIEISLNHTKTFRQEGRKLSTDLRITDNDDLEISDLVERYSFIGSQPTFQRSSNTEDEQNLIFNSDYTHPIGKEGKFETGVRASFRNIENFYSVELRGSETEDWVTLTAFTDDLIYIENIYAAYAMYGNTFQRWSFQAGMRAEYTDILTRLVVSDVENPREYLNFFPSGHLNYKLDETNSLQISYSRRLSRPSFRQLIPFFGYTDPRLFYGGNPDLNPEYTDSYEAGFLKMHDKGSFLGSVYYRRTTDVVQRITLTDTTGLIRTFPVNLGVQDAYGVEANLSLNLQKWWRVNGNVNVYYANIQGSYRDVSYDTDLITMLGRINTVVSLPKKIDLQASGRYSAPMNTPQGKTLSVTTMDLGLARDFFKGNGTLVFNVVDVFNTGYRRSIIDTEFLQSQNQFQWRVRQFMLTFNYRINQRKERPGGRPNGAEGMDGDF